MKIQAANSRKASGGGYILYGNIEAQGWKWFEKWYKTKEAAKLYADKKGWDYIEVVGNYENH